jgi:hypothetical protein
MGQVELGSKRIFSEINKKKRKEKKEI